MLGSSVATMAARFLHIFSKEIYHGTRLPSRTHLDLLCKLPESLTFLVTAVMTPQKHIFMFALISLAISCHMKVVLKFTFPLKKCLFCSWLHAWHRGQCWYMCPFDSACILSLLYSTMPAMVA